MQKIYFIALFLTFYFISAYSTNIQGPAPQAGQTSGQNGAYMGPRKLGPISLKVKSFSLGDLKKFSRGIVRSPFFKRYGARNSKFFNNRRISSYNQRRKLSNQRRNSYNRRESIYNRRRNSYNRRGRNTAHPNRVFKKKVFSLIRKAKQYKEILSEISSDKKILKKKLEDIIDRYMDF